MALRDVIGQDRAINILLRTIQIGKIPSAYLFAGESGIGKKFTAINLAKALNCQNEGGDCCDECSSCRKIAAKVHPDILLISPEEGQIRIEEIRAIDNTLSFKPFEGRKKVIIVDEADNMNPYAANAFLKTLEEPPEDSLIILISSSPDRLPDTIKSRCSRVNFTPLPSEACEKVIKTVITHRSTLNTISLLVRLSMGRPGLAISGDLIEERAWFMKLLGEMLQAEKNGWTSKEDMGKWLNLAFNLLRDMVIMKITNDETKLINIDLAEYIKKLSNSMNLKVIIENYQKLNTVRRYLNFNLNRSLTWNYIGSILRKREG
ncbi:MAG: DNA polymerase III subunit delta' [Nitrospirota bacterium]